MRVFLHLSVVPVSVARARVCVTLPVDSVIHGSQKLKTRYCCSVFVQPSPLPFLHARISLRPPKTRRSKANQEQKRKKTTKKKGVKAFLNFASKNGEQKARGKKRSVGKKYFKGV